MTSNCSGLSPFISVLMTMMVSTGTRDSSKNGTASPVLAKSVFGTRRVCAGTALVICGITAGTGNTSPRCIWVGSGSGAKRSLF